MTDLRRVATLMENAVISECSLLHRIACDSGTTNESIQELDRVSLILTKIQTNTPPFTERRIPIYVHQFSLVADLLHLAADTDYKISITSLSSITVLGALVTALLLRAIPLVLAVFGGSSSSESKSSIKSLLPSTVVWGL